MPSTALSTNSVASRVLTIIGFDVETIITEMGINASSSNMTYLSQVTYQQLGVRLTNEFRIAINYKQLYHMSVYNLIDTVLVRRNLRGMKIAVEEAIRYIALQMTLQKVRLMYQIHPRDLMNSSLVSLLVEHSQVEGSEVAIALNVTSSQEKLLARARLVDAQILLGINREIFRMTPEQIGHRLINLNAETVMLFTPIRELLAARNLSLASLSKLKLPSLLTSIPSATINQIFKRLNITKDSRIFIDSNTLAEIAAARAMELTVFSTWHVFRVIWDFKAMISRGELIWYLYSQYLYNQFALERLNSVKRTPF